MKNIHDKALAHKDKYASFDLERFMDWCEAKAKENPNWIRWASGRSMKRLNQSRRSQEGLKRLADSDSG